MASTTFPYQGFVNGITHHQNTEGFSQTTSENKTNSLLSQVSSYGYKLASAVDKAVIQPTLGDITGLRKAQDNHTIAQINDFINHNIQIVPRVFQQAFGESPKAIEREAAHSLWIRVFIEKSQIPLKAQELIKSIQLRDAEQVHVGIAYLTGIELGNEKAAQTYPKFAPRVQQAVSEFTKQADQADALHFEQLPETSIAGDRIRPRNLSNRIDLGPKVVRHPVTSLTLGEFRRAINPKRQQIIDQHFHLLNLRSRPLEVQKMKEQGGDLQEHTGVKQTTFSKQVQIEFFPDKNETANPPFLDNIQGKGALTTEGKIAEFSHGQKKIYVMQYLDYQNDSEKNNNGIKYLVSSEVPVGNTHEKYTPDLSEEEARALVAEHLDLSPAALNDFQFPALKM